MNHADFNPIQACIRPEVVAMQAYAVQTADGLVKLDAMENPHRLPPELQTELGRRLGALALNRYPAGRIEDLRRALAFHADLPKGFGLMLGNGSDELISLLAMACDMPGEAGSGGRPAASVLAPQPGFVMYGLSARLQGLAFVGVDLTADFELDEAAMLAAIDEHRPAIIYLAYPNNPTANLWDDAVIDKIVEAAPGLVVIDEAYQPFSSRSYAGRMARHGHVLLMRTMSKFGLAGVRIGYLMGPAGLIAEIDKVRPPYNISVLNCEAALFALEHADVFEAQAQDIRAQRSLLQRRLAELPGIKAWRSDANMILVRLPERPGMVSGPALDAGPDRAQAAFEQMKAQGVLVKNVSKMHPLLAGCLRLTVGTADENARMLSALQTCL